MSFECQIGIDDDSKVPELENTFYSFTIEKKRWNISQFCIMAFVEQHKFSFELIDREFIGNAPVVEFGKSGSEDINNFNWNLAMGIEY